MRIACSLGSLLSINQVLECTKILAKTKVDTIWIPETWGMENFSMLSAVSHNTDTQKIGSSIINIYSRSPSAIAMGAATIDTLSKGRLVLGLGTSSPPIIETFHGYKFEKPLQRMKEYVEIIRLILSGKQVNYSGQIFDLKNFTLLIKPTQVTIPIYLAAVNKKMIELTWDIADGVIFYLRPLKELKETITKNGFRDETYNIFDEFKRSGFKSNHELVTDSMLQSLCISGTPDECKKQLDNFYDTGINLPIIQFNPVGDVTESFELLKKTFLEK